LEDGDENADPIFTFREQWIQSGDGVLGASLSPLSMFSVQCSMFNVRVIDAQPFFGMPLMNFVGKRSGIVP